MPSFKDNTEATSLPCAIQNAGGSFSLEGPGHELGTLNSQLSISAQGCTLPQPASTQHMHLASPLAT